MNRLGVLVVVALGLPAAGAWAGSAPNETYCATLSPADHYASDGFELTDAASILRQDRANFHKFGIRDPRDSADATFRSTAARAKIPAMLKRGSIDGDVRRAIVRGAPDVCVDIYDRSIDVYFAGGQ